MGSHMADIAPADFREAVKILYAGELFAIFAVAISKTSFAVTLLRLATQPWQRWGLWYIIGSINLIMGLCGLFQYIQCSPVSKIWDITVPGTCWDPMVTIRYALFAGCEFSFWGRPNVSFFFWCAATVFPASRY